MCFTYTIIYSEQIGSPIKAMFNKKLKRKANDKMKNYIDRILAFRTKQGGTKRNMAKRTKQGDTK